jgi:hypothetical protein
MLMEKKQLYVLLALAKCNYVITSFDLWVLKGTQYFYINDQFFGG